MKKLRNRFLTLSDQEKRSPPKRAWFWKENLLQAYQQLTDCLDLSDALQAVGGVD